jgi:hypothetical protein
VSEPIREHQTALHEKAGTNKAGAL